MNSRLAPGPNPLKRVAGEPASAGLTSLQPRIHSRCYRGSACADYDRVSASLRRRCLPGRWPRPERQPGHFSAARRTLSLSLALGSSRYTGAISGTKRPFLVLPWYCLWYAPGPRLVQNTCRSEAQVRRASWPLPSIAPLSIPANAPGGGSAASNGRRSLLSSGPKLVAAHRGAPEENRCDTDP
jgi:hypothetical protein